MKHLLVALFLVIKIEIGYGKMVGTLGKGYKQSCSESEPCNGVKFLECQMGVCECIARNEIYFDPVMEQCAVLVGYSCLRQIPGSSSGSKGSEENTPKYQMACVEHAKCSYPADICECDFRYYKGSDSKCLKQKNFGDRCSADEQCDKYKFLSCIGGTCTCDKNHLYDKKNDKCMVIVGAECTIIDYITISEEHYQEDECPEDAFCNPTQPESNKGICQCDHGFKLSSDKTCGRDWGDECGINMKCSDVQFICRNGVCQCKYAPLHQYFDEETRSCISLAGGPCDSSNSADESLTFCTENAICQESNPFNFCKCKQGFTEDNDGKCVKAYGTDCEKDEECDDIPLPNGLACIENTCSCPDKLQIYDEKQRSCLSLAGGRCRKDANSTLPVCTNNAYCVKASTNNQVLYGRCICGRGMTTTSNRLCSKG